MQAMGKKVKVIRISVIILRFRGALRGEGSISPQARFCELRSPNPYRAG